MLPADHHAGEGRAAPPLAAIAASVQDALIAADATSTIIFWSPGAQHIFGWSEQQALGRPLTTLMPERFRDAHRSGIARLAAGGEPRVLGGSPLELVALHADGREFPVELTLGSWRDEDGRVLFTGVVRDVSERARGRLILSVQYEVAAALAGSQELDDGLSRALAAIATGMGWRAAHLWALDENGRLRCRASWHEEDPALDAFAELSGARTFVVGEGVPGRVLATGRPEWLADLLDDPTFARAEPARGAGLVSAIFLPLTAEGETRGVAELFASEPRPQDTGLMEAMTALAGQLGQFLLRREAEAGLAEANAELDQRRRAQRQAAELNDEVVQGLVMAHYHLTGGDIERASAALAVTLDAAKAIVGDLLADAELEPGSLRRAGPPRLDLG